MAKGAAYERKLCGEISLWYSDGKFGDLLWRSSQSGGRATSRAKCGKRTAGHAGDICATCPEGEPITRHITWECKSGYNRSAFMADLIDRKAWSANKKARSATILGFIEQAIAAAERAGTRWWALVHRRDKRGSTIYLPTGLCHRLIPQDDLPVPHCYFHTRVGRGELTFVCLRLADFFTSANPRDIDRLRGNK
jgi:hypothetical protein